MDAVLACRAATALPFPLAACEARKHLCACAGFNVFGELASQASRLSPDGVMDPAVGQLVAAGLASAATLLTASLMRSAYKRAHACASYTYTVETRICRPWCGG